MRVDGLPKSDSLWYEDQFGNKFDQNTWDNLVKDSSKTWYQHIMNPVVRHDVYQSNKNAKWPVKVLNWCSRKLPTSWHGHRPLVYSASDSINCIYPIVRYLVDNKGWHFSEACIVSSQLCERCLNICLDECQGTTSQYTTKTHCGYCQYIDPDYLERRRVWCCYRTLKLGGDVAKAWKEMGINSGPEYWSEPDKHTSILQVAKHKMNLLFSKKQEPKGTRP